MRSIKSAAQGYRDAAPFDGGGDDVDMRYKGVFEETSTHRHRELHELLLACRLRAYEAKARSASAVAVVLAEKR